MLLSQVLVLSAALLSYASSTTSPTSTVYPLLPPLGPSTGVFTVDQTLPFDGPKLDHVNATTSDWWYFDAVSDDGSTQITIVFFSAEATTLGFPTTLGTSNFVVFTALFDNGTIYQNFIPGGDATIITIGDGSSGNFSLTGGTWAGAPDLSSYEVEVDNALVGISGSMKLKSIAPAHVPCDGNSAGASEHLTDTIGWANSVPDADAVVNFTINGDRLKFAGSGYHDKNWGLKPLPDAVGSWYWGHARLGPYSIVYFDVLQRDSSEIVSAYLSKEGKVVSLGCSGLKVRPIGTEFPPTVTTPVPEGFTLEYQTESGTLVANLTGSTAWVAPLDHPGWGYDRFSGVIQGGFKGQEQFSGPAVFEWIRFLPLSD
ncbi:hypothetical protein F5884DRAFT_679389 [Xylogone sp. PMI_703]|nr:hypothetical protein F5884DRAFT_679389 [Xylogone sp. PMI_703]